MGRSCVNSGQRQSITSIGIYNCSNHGLRTIPLLERVSPFISCVFRILRVYINGKDDLITLLQGSDIDVIIVAISTQQSFPLGIFAYFIIITTVAYVIPPAHRYLRGGIPLAASGKYGCRHQAECHHKRQQQRQQPMGLVASHAVFLLVCILYLQTPQRDKGIRADHAAGIEPMGMR